MNSYEVVFSFWISHTSVPAPVDLYMSTKIQFEAYAGCMIGVCCLMLNLTHCTIYPYTVPLLSQCLNTCDIIYITDQMSPQHNSCTVNSILVPLCHPLVISYTMGHFSNLTLTASCPAIVVCQSWQPY